MGPNLGLFWQIKEYSKPDFRYPQSDRFTGLFQELKEQETRRPVPGQKYLLSLPPESEDAEGRELSDANIWQRRHRIRAKLVKFFRKGG